MAGTRNNSMDRSDDPLHHKQTLYDGATFHSKMHIVTYLQLFNTDYK